MGVRHVTLHDHKNTTHYDLSSQFYLSEESVGRNRAEACADALASLSDLCTVQVQNTDTPLDEQFLAQFTVCSSNLLSLYFLGKEITYSQRRQKVVVFSDAPIAELVQVNRMCRKHGVKFIASEIRGVFGAIFVDFGENFVVKDVNGEQPANGIVVSIEVDERGHAIVDTFDRDNSEHLSHSLDTDDMVVFSHVEGMTELNDGVARKVRRISPTKFDIGNVSQYSTYTGGGYWTEVKQYKTLSFRSLEECLVEPRCEMLYDYGKTDHPPQMHICFMALSEFYKTRQRYPRSYNEEDADEMIKIAHEINASRMSEISRVGSLNEELVKRLSYTALGQLNPMAAFIGGLVAQEAQKACTQRFHPIHQWFYFESCLSLPDPLPTSHQCQPIQSRYDGQIAVFGLSMHKTLENMNTFLVGAGALGCEFLKNFAMMGVGCGPKGKVTVTDMDSIETSNLSRQFLFRQHHVGKMKSDVATIAATEMNPHLNVKSMQDRLAPETEDVFDDKFWERLDIVTSALDNVEARLYVDSRCVYYRKPLLESGTLGTKGHVQCIIPCMTESYASQRDAPQKEFPKCTIHQFPNVIQHTIAWASELFHSTFTSSVELSNSYLADPKAFLQTPAGNNLSSIETVHDLLIRNRPRSYQDCVRWARIRFEELFNHAIRNIVHTFPLDKKTESGAPFWSGNKRSPTPIEFDANDPTHMQFIEASTRLYAEVHCITNDIASANLMEIATDADVPEYVPLTVQTDDDNESKNEDNAMDEVGESFSGASTHLDANTIMERLTKELEDHMMEDFRVQHLVELHFEKDNDSNWHMNFITAASNLRARAYKIPETDKYRTKGIAGNIIPAMITTTALITGLVCLELYKIALKRNRCEDFRNCFVNIGIPFVTMSEPVSAPRQYADKWTLWDRFEVNEGRDITLGQLLAKIKDDHELNVVGVNYGSLVVYHEFMGSKEEREQRLSTPAARLIELLTRVKHRRKQRFLHLHIHAIDKDGDMMGELPVIRYHFRAPESSATSSGIMKKKRKRMKVTK